MNIRPIVETSFHHVFRGRVDPTSISFKKALEWAVFDCEAAIELLPVKDRESVVAIIETAIKSAEHDFEAAGELR